jgi:hypothetical protein
MISFDLRCSGAHVFEVWFRSSADYDDQRSRALIVCPICGDSDVAKAVMAPNVTAKGNQRSTTVAHDTPVDASAAMIAGADQALPAPVREALAAIARAQAEALPRSRWVGESFAAEARARHQSDDAGYEPIHGQTTPDEARALMEDGIAVMPLLVPFTPPDKRN